MLYIRIPNRRPIKIDELRKKTREDLNRDIQYHYRVYDGEFTTTPSVNVDSLKK